MIWNEIGLRKLYSRLPTLDRLTFDRSSLWQGHRWCQSKATEYANHLYQYFQSVRSSFQQPTNVLNINPETYLKPNDSAYNLKKISRLDLNHLLPSICTAEIHKMVPKQNPMELGYASAVDLQTKLGDDFIASSVGLAALATLMLSMVKLVGCIKESPHAEDVATGVCFKEIGEAMVFPTVLAGGVLLAEAYFHSQGFLGQLLHDRHHGSRVKMTLALYHAMANELDGQIRQAQASNNEQSLKDLEILTIQIRKNLPLILDQIALHLQVDKSEIKEAIDHLDWACQGTRHQVCTKFSGECVEAENTGGNIRASLLSYLKTYGSKWDLFVFIALSYILRRRYLWV